LTVGYGAVGFVSRVEERSGMIVKIDIFRIVLASEARKLLDHGPMAWRTSSEHRAEHEMRTFILEVCTDWHDDNYCIMHMHLGGRGIVDSQFSRVISTSSSRGRLTTAEIIHTYSLSPATSVSNAPWWSSASPICRGTLTIFRIFQNHAKLYISPHRN
jgi:hypothetical protein